MLALIPGRNHLPLATAIADVVETEGCLYASKDCQRRTAAMLVSIALRESTFHVDALGDCDKGDKTKRSCRSVCAFQVLGGSRALLTDARACTLEGYRRLKTSLQACRGSMAMYAAGRCDSEAGQRIDADRKRLAARILGGSK